MWVRACHQSLQKCDRQAHTRRTPTIWASHDRWRVAAGPSTGAADVNSDQRDKQQSNVSSGNWKKQGRISCWRGLVLTAEAKKADGANETTDLTLNPPSRTGNEDCNHWLSESCTFKTSSRPARTITSKRAKRSLSTQYEVRIIYNNLGSLMQLLMIDSE